MALCGSFNVGKTTLVNALLDQEVLPTARRETTPCPVEIRGAPLPPLAPLPWWGLLLTLGLARMFHRRAEALREAWVLPPVVEADHGQGWLARDAQWLAATRIGGDADVPHRIRVGVPGSRRLSPDLVLVDTAGLDGRDEERDGHTVHAACCADRILLLVLGRKALTKAERAFLEQLGPHRRRVHLVLGHADLVPDEDREVIEEDLAAVTGDHPGAVADGWTWCALPPEDERYPEDAAERQRSVDAILDQLRTAHHPQARRRLLEDAAAAWEAQATARVEEVWNGRSSALDTLVDGRVAQWRRHIVGMRKELRGALQDLASAAVVVPDFELEAPAGANQVAAQRWTEEARMARETAVQGVQVVFDAMLTASHARAGELLQTAMDRARLPPAEGDTGLAVPEPTMAMVEALIDLASVAVTVEAPGWIQRTFSFAEALNALQTQANTRVAELQQALEQARVAADHALKEGVRNLERQALDRYDAAAAQGGSQRIRSALQVALETGHARDRQRIRDLAEEIRRARGL